MRALFVANVDRFHKSFHLPHIKHLKENGVNVDVASFGTMEIGGVNQKFNIEFGRTPFAIENIKAFFQLRRVLKRQYDIVYLSTPVVGVIGRLALIGKKHTRVIYSAHGFSFYKGNSKLKNEIFLFIEKLFALNTDCIFTMNQEDFDNCKKYDFRTKEIYNVDGVGIDTSDFSVPNYKEKLLLRKKNTFAEDSFILIYPAELSNRKNQQLLLKIVQRLKEKYDRILLLLPGKGVLLDDYSKMALRLGILDNVKFLGYRTDVNELLKLSDVFVASSYNEGLPVSMIEAMATGLPIVATRARGHVDLVCENENGFLFDFDDITKAVDAISLLMENSNCIYQRLSNNSVQMSKKYDISNVIPQYDKIWGINNL